ncbi:MAG: Mrp/NBP35 family ATP-binding protein [Anaerovoracaceae bacterium]
MSENVSENCSHNCSSCGENCGERTAESFLKKPHEKSNIKKVIAVVSGKGGVGKSLVTGLSSVISSRCEYKTAILDADITGPSIPKMFGISGLVNGSPEGIVPATTSTGIKLISTNLILENPTDPVIWRGPVIGGVVEQFWTDVIWGDIDYMFIDMPPGTGDVPLTVFQSLPIDGIIIVASPQELVSMIVEKAVKMADMMNIPILGLVENMSYVQCPDCGKEIKIFGESKVEQIAKEKGLEVLGKLPIEPKLAELCDKGEIEKFEGAWLQKIAEKLVTILPL